MKKQQLKEQLAKLESQAARLEDKLSAMSEWVHARRHHLYVHHADDPLHKSERQIVDDLAVWLENLRAWRN
jgi:fatty-acid desaturase